MKLKRKLVIPILLILLAIRIINGSPKNYLDITFLDVGQGNGTFISCNQGKGIMIDNGSTSKSELLKYTTLPFLKAKGIDEITYWFISHSDKDHTSGLIEYLASYDNSMPTVKNIVIPKNHLPSNVYDEIAFYSNKNHIKLLYMSSKDSIKLKDDYNGILNIKCLSPSDDMKIDDHNSESLVLLCSYNSFQALLLGDMPYKYDSNVIEEFKNSDCVDDTLEIIEASHHGSKTGTSDELLSYTNSKYAVISVGSNNSYGHPHSELINRLKKFRIKYYQTNICGAINVNVTNKEMKINYMKGGI